MEELWSDIRGYGGKYQVSNFGRVRKRCVFVYRYFRPYITRYGYAYTTLTDKNGSKQIFVHLLVAEAFLGPKPKGKDVHHKDGNKQNNYWQNLAYVTRGENLEHAWSNDLRPKRLWFTEEQINDMRACIANGATLRELGKMYGCGHETIRRAIKGTRNYLKKVV